MAYEYLIEALDRLPTETRQIEVQRIAAPPRQRNKLRRAGLKRIAAHPELVARWVGGISRSLAERVADDPFLYGDRCRPGRYSIGFPALYTSADFETARAEIKYYLKKNGATSGGKRPEYVIFVGEVDGPRRDLQLFEPAHQTELVHDADWRPTQSIGTAARARSLHYLDAPSARRRSGTNHPVFERSSVRSASINQKITFSEDAAGSIVYETGPL